MSDSDRCTCRDFGGMAPGQFHTRCAYHAGRAASGSPAWAPRVYADTVEVEGVVYPRCVRAVGITRCTGYVTDGGDDCGSHGH